MNQVPKIVRQRLGATSDPAHPDANLLSAYAQKALDQREEATILGHLAQCADCRQLLFLAQPELEAAPQVVRQPAKAPAGFHGMRWAFWAAAVLVVGGLLMLNDRQQSSHDQMAQVARPAMTQPTPASPSPATAPTDEVAAPAMSANAKAKTETGIMPKTLAQPESSRPTEVATLDQLQSGPAPSVHSENSPARDSSLSKQSEGKASDAEERKDAAAGAFAPRAAFAGDAKAEANRMAANAMVLSKTSGPRWTLTPDGVLERSFDAGQTWETVPVAANATFRVVSALGSDIWVGGAAGALYHSKDAGQHWEQVKPAVDGNALTADITGLEFSDAQHGKVASASGVWTTSDAGETWQKQ
jgi:hypothetical protein